MEMILQKQTDFGISTFHGFLNIKFKFNEILKLYGIFGTQMNA